jgi:hypothetical protein
MGLGAGHSPESVSGISEGLSLNWIQNLARQRSFGLEGGQPIKEDPPVPFKASFSISCQDYYEKIFEMKTRFWVAWRPFPKPQAEKGCRANPAPVETNC